MIRTKNLNIEMKNYNITKIDKRSTSTDKKYRDGKNAIFAISCMNIHVWHFDHTFKD